MQRQVALRHAVDKAVDRRFVVVGGKRSGQPQAKGPGRWQRRTTGELGIAVQHLFRGWAVDNEVFQILAFHAELHLGDFLRANLEGDVFRVIHQHAIAAVGQVERNIFVGLFGTGAAVFIPGFDVLAVAHQRGKALTQAVNGFTHTKVQTLEHVVAIVVAVLHVAVVFQLTAGNANAVAQEVQRPEFTFGDAHAQVAAFQLGKLGGVLDLYLHVFQHVQRIVRPFIQRALEVLNAHADHAFLRGEKAKGEHRRV